MMHPLTQKQNLRRLRTNAQIYTLRMKTYTHCGFRLKLTKVSSYKNYTLQKCVGSCKMFNASPCLLAPFLSYPLI